MKKQASDLEIQFRHTFEASREAMRVAHDRAEAAAERARQMRADLRRRRTAAENPSLSAEQTLGMLRLATEESARSVRENERFLAVVSHELRQPLTAALTAAALIDEQQAGVPAPRARAVLRRQLLHMSSLLDDLLDMSRLTLRAMNLKTSRLDLRTVLRDAVDTVEAAALQRSLTIKAEIPGTEIPVNGDPARLQQVFSNLLANAVRYTPSGGTVTLGVEVDAEVAVVSVVDSGQGISPADLPKIFEPFWRGGDTGPEGFGIGLALVLGIVELHGGSIVAGSEGVGRGARFTVSLPLITP